MTHPFVCARVQGLSRAVALVLVLAAAGPAWSAGAEPFTELLEASLKDRKGVVLYVKGQAIAGRVTKLTDEGVELTSREYARIVVRREAIDGVAGN